MVTECEAPISPELRAPAGFEDRPALLWADGGWTHAELWTEAEAAARELRLGRKGLVFLVFHPTPASVRAYLGALLAGHAVVLLDAGRAPDALLERYRPDWIIDGTPTRLPGSDAPLHPDLSLLLTTSGSTDSPKLVRLSAGAVAHNARAIAEALALGPEERAIGSLPLHYAYGLSVLDSHLVAGGSLRLTTHSPVQRSFWAEAADCTSFAGVPTSYQFLKRLDLDTLAPAGLRTMTQAGGALAPALADHFATWLEARGGGFTVMYGQTEATARITVLPPGERVARRDSVGRVLPGGRLRIDEGEVVYTGPNVMLGYAREREDLARGDELGGVLRTGDLGELDDEGYLRLHGRSRRIAKLFGHRVNLDEIELMLQVHGPTGVLGAPDRLLVACAWGEAEALEEQRRTLAARLRVHHGAVSFHRVEALPRSSRGKIDYGALATALLEEGA